MSFYLSIVILAAASILNILLPEPKKLNPTLNQEGRSVQQ